MKTITSIIASGENLTVEFKESKTKLNKDFVTTINNPQKLNPPFYLNMETLGINNKKILHIEVPQSPSVHTLNGKIYDRNNDSDISISGQNANIAKLYLLKQDIAKVFREIGFADELGSGVKNLYKYSKAYGGSDPVIVEGEVFRIEVQTQLETAQDHEG